MHAIFYKQMRYEMITLFSILSRSRIELDNL